MLPFGHDICYIDKARLSLERFALGYLLRNGNFGRDLNEMSSIIM